MKKLALGLALCVALGSVATPAKADHPQLRKIAKIAGIGALTGGIGGLILGSGVAAGAATGAATHVGFHEAHHWWQRHEAARTYGYYY